MENLCVEMDMLQKDFAVHIGNGNEEQEHAMVEKLGELYKKMLNLDNPRNFLLDLAQKYLQGENLPKHKINSTMQEQRSIWAKRYRDIMGCCFEL